MARRNKNKHEDDTLVDIVEVKDNAADFFQENQSKIIGGLVGLFLLIGGIFAYNSMYKIPRQNTAMEQMAAAQFQFEQDSFARALENPAGPESEGFLDIIDNYSGTKAANVANYYAGICWLRLGEYDAAIDHLTNFSANGDISPIVKFGALGDAYSEKSDYGNALSYYNKAINAGDNEVLSAYYLQKTGLLHEMQGEYQEAVQSFKQIKENYPLSSEGKEIEKYIDRVTAKI